jgi:sarcosine oxidase
MTRGYDVAIAGLGAMGSAAALSLARRGLGVIGFDRFAPPHDRGSSHGETRIIRVAYFEDPRYVPLVKRAWDLWVDLERTTGVRLLEPTGGLMIGPLDGVLVRGALASARAHGLPHDLLDASRLASRFPAHRPAPGDVAVWEPMAGVLSPEAGVAAQLAAARAAGAELRADEPVERWEGDGDGVRVTTARGVTFASRLVLAAGAWLGRLSPDLEPRLEVTRQPLMWFEPLAHERSFDAGSFPIFIREHQPGRFVYGFPRRGGLVKFAIHMEGERTDPDTVRREVEDAEVERLREILARCLPDAAGACRRRAVCLYTNTPDGHFRIGRLSRQPRVVVASCCSGHGFKFAPVIGEILADLATDRTPGFDLEPFALERS